MAEIRLEQKRKMGWLWLVLLLIVAALVLWWLWQAGYLGGSSVNADTTVLNVMRTGLATIAAGAGTA